MIECLKQATKAAISLVKYCFFSGDKVQTYGSWSAVNKHNFHWEYIPFSHFPWDEDMPINNNYGSADI